MAADPSYDAEVPEIEFTESAMEIGEIIDKYEAFTGRSTMRDGTIQGTQLPLRSNGKMTRRQASEYIKAFLLLNGYSIVPSDIKGVDKVIPTARGPQVEQGGSQQPIFTAADKLPETEQIINYVMYLKNIGAEEAARSLTTVIGQSRQNVSKITPIPAAGALIITDNLPAIRLAIALRESIDVPSAAVVKEFFQLERADAEEVAQVLTEILAAQTRLRSQASGGTGARGVPVNIAADQLQQAGLPPGAIPSPGQGGAAAGGTQPPDESTVIVKAITRTNEVLISGRPSDLSYLRDLIKELDKEANVKNLKRFQLRFIRVEDFLQIAEDAIGRGQEVMAGGTGGGAVPGGARTGAGVRNTGAGFQGNQAFGGGQTFGANATGGGTGRASRTQGAGGGLASGRSSSTSASGEELIPSSTIVGKTLLIAEPRSNSLLVAGPPEHLTRIAEVLDEMDVRPLQVAISTVIAEITLTDDLEYGIDILRKAEQIVAGGQDINWAGALNNIGDTTGIIDPGDLADVADFNNVPGGLNIYASLGEFFNVYIKAIEATGRAQVLSRPFVFTANNKEANISVGRRIPVPSNTQSNTVDNTTTFNTNIEYEDVNLEILVTPLINSKNEVTLTITEINDGLGPERQVGEQSVPEITQQFLTTEITVPNGGIAVIGGVIQETDDRTNRGVPWLARVPILRGLLGNTVKGRRRSELLFFIQPRIVETSEELEGMHTEQLRRTAVGKKAQEFAKPAFDTSDVILPTESGDIRLDDAHRLLPHAHPAENPPPSPEPPTSDFPPPDAQLKALDLDQPRNLNELPSTLPNEKRQPAFWEKSTEETTSPNPPAAPPKKEKSGPSKLLPWNWGKKKNAKQSD
ncbi:MAG: secretin N-terminal domain-containing protein [Verrucomicrobiales bacterium]